MIRHTIISLNGTNNDFVNEIQYISGKLYHILDVAQMEDSFM